MAFTKVLYYWLLTSALHNGGFATQEDGQASKPELHIMGLFPMTKGAWQGGQAVKLAAELAIEHINNRTDVLPDHALRLHWQDSQCLVGPAMNALFQQLYEPPVKHIIFGPACSITCQPTAQSSQSWNISQIAYGCGSPSLSDKTVYKRFFRTVIPDTSIVPLHIEMMRLFQWGKIATVHQSYDVFSSATDHLLESVSDNVTVLLSAAFLTDPSLQVANLKKHDARIIFGAFYPNAARKVFCEAYKHGLYGPKIVWILAKWFPDDWWRGDDTDCTVEQLQEAVTVDGVLYGGMSPFNPQDVRGLAGVSNSQLLQMVGERSGGQHLFGQERAAVFYDGMWSVALALNKSVQNLREIGHPKALDQFDYSDDDIGDIMTQSAFQVDFEGVLGRLTFDEHGDPTRVIAIDQQQGEERVTVGYYNPATEGNDGNIFWFNGGIRWIGGRPPRDSSIITREHQYVSEVLYGTMCTVGAIGIATTIFFFIFNIGFRNRSLIRMSSPNINNLILLGCWLGYSTVFLQERPGSNIKEDGLCVVREFAFLIAFSLAFGGLFSKTWRIHRVLTMSSKLKKMVIKDSKLLGIVLALVLTDVLILGIWQIVDPLTLVIKDLDKEVSEADPDVETIPYLHVCDRDYKMYFTGVIYVIQGSLLAFGAFLAWETRKVKVEALNDSKQIGVCIYNVLTLSVLGAAVSLVVEDNINVYYGFTSAIILIGTTLIQGIIFVPKVLGVKRGDVAVHSSSLGSHPSASGGSHRVTTTTSQGGNRLA